MAGQQYLYLAGNNFTSSYLDIPEWIIYNWKHTGRINIHKCSLYLFFHKFQNILNVCWHTVKSVCFLCFFCVWGGCWQLSFLGAGDKQLYHNAVVHISVKAQIGDGYFGDGYSVNLWHSSRSSSIAHKPLLPQSFLGHTTPCRPYANIGHV